MNDFAIDTASHTEYLETAIGPSNTEFYLRQFAKFEQGQGLISWNWPAFFITFYWMLYRKLWAWAAAYFFVPPILSLVLIVILAGLIGQTGILLGWLLALGVTWIVVPMYANALYFRVVRRRIAQAQAGAGDRERQLRLLAANGGTSPIALIVALVIGVGVVPVIGILAAIAIPAYQDYTIRAQVTEGLNLANQARIAIAETYTSSGSFPDSNAASSIPAEALLGGGYTSGVAVLAGGQIRITYGNQAHFKIAGDTLFLTPYLDASGQLAWQCGNFDLRSSGLSRSPGASIPLEGGTLEHQYRPFNCRG